MSDHQEQIEPVFKASLPNAADETLEQYLSELERELGRTLRQSEVEPLVTEVREHLEASLRARMELGKIPEIAAREAIADFGTAKAVSRREEALRRQRFQTFFLGCVTLGGVAWAFTILASPVLGSKGVIMAGISFFMSLGALVETSKARRPWPPVLGATLAFWLAFSAICAAWVHDFTFVGWMSPKPGPLDLAHAAVWSGGASLVFLFYLALAYRIARPGADDRVGE